MNQAQLARHLGVNRSTIHKYVKRGRLVLGDDGKVDVDDAMRQLEETESMAPHHQARKQQIEAEKKQLRESSVESDDVGNADDAASVAQKLRFAMMRERQAKADKAEMEAAKMAGDLVLAEEVRFVLQDVGATYRAAVEQLPDRLAPEVAGCAADQEKIHLLLSDYACSMLEQVRDVIARRAEGWVGREQAND